MSEVEAQKMYRVTIRATGTRIEDVAGLVGIFADKIRQGAQQQQQEGRLGMATGVCAVLLDPSDDSEVRGSATGVKLAPAPAPLAAQAPGWRAPLLGAVTLPSPFGEVGIDVYRDPSSRWLFGVDSSFSEQEVADYVPSPFGYGLLDITDDADGARAVPVSITGFLVPEQLSGEESAVYALEQDVRVVGVVALPDPRTDQITRLCLFESGGLFAVEEGYLARGRRVIQHVFAHSEMRALVLPPLDAQALVPTQLKAVVYR